MNVGESIKLPAGTLLAAPHNPQMPQVYGSAAFRFSIGGGKWTEEPSVILVQRKASGVRLIKDPEKKVRAIFPDPADTTLEPVALAITLAGGHHEHSAPAFGGSCHSHPLTGGATSRSKPYGYQSMPGIPLAVKSDCRCSGLFRSDLEAEEGLFVPICGPPPDIVI